MNDTGRCVEARLEIVDEAQVTGFERCVQIVWCQRHDTPARCGHDVGEPCPCVVGITGEPQRLDTGVDGVTANTVRTVRAGAQPAVDHPDLRRPTRIDRQRHVGNCHDQCDAESGKYELFDHNRLCARFVILGAGETTAAALRQGTDTARAAQAGGSSALHDRVIWCHNPGTGVAIRTSMLTAEKIRARSDVELFNKITRHPDVKRVTEELERAADKGPGGVRRRLLATSVRLSKEMAPGVRAIADDCIQRLGISIPVEIYVYASPSYNAACVKPEEGRLFVMFSSSLLERFSDSELRFVMGHELGHYLYRHHDIPIGYLLMGKNRPSPGLALQLFAWSRYAEISADRAGAHCAQDFESVGRGLFKLASGLSGDVVTFNLSDFLQQIDEMQSSDADSVQGAPMEDWFSTHPFSPLRVKALQLYHASELVMKRGISTAELEARVTSLMGLMEPSYLESKTDAAEAMRRLLFAGAISIADASQGISADEVAAFEQFFGKHSFKTSFDIKQIKDDLEERIDHARELASHAQCTQVVRDLCVIARADSRVAPEERNTLLRIAMKLDVGVPFVERCLESDPELD